MSLSYHGCNIREYYESQDLISYFDMLNGPTYTNLIRHIWVKAHIYDKKAAQQEMDENVLIDPTLAGKTREEMGLEPSRVLRLGKASWVFLSSSLRK